MLTAVAPLAPPRLTDHQVYSPFHSADEKLGVRQHLHTADPPPAWFKADAEISAEFLLLRERAQRLQVSRPYVRLALDLDGRVVAEDEVDLEA